MSGFVDRENQIFEIIHEFKEHDLEFVVVGGYAVSAYQRRFSVDADLVIQQKDLEQFTEILEEHGFEEVENRKLDAYGGQYLAYERNREYPVTIDLLVNSLKCRQTDASWSYKHFQEHSIVAEIQGSERTIKAQIPEKELLVAVKLHSGRLTDARDAVALADNLDLEKLDDHFDRGDPEKRRNQLEEVGRIVQSEDFEDAFKGVFQQGELPNDRINNVTRFLDRS